MLNEPTLEQLRGLKLNALVATWHEQAQQASITALGFDERFAMLVDAEWRQRENQRLVRVLKEAKLKLSQACIEDIDYSARRELDRAVMRQLATCSWVHEHHNVLITGATGVGKTFIACALAQQACRRGYKALYRRASRLFDEFHLARADGTYARLLARLARTDVLVIDDWGLAAVQDQERQHLLEILEDRHGARSTIVTSQLPPPSWHAHIGDPTLAMPSVTACCTTRTALRSKVPRAVSNPRSQQRDHSKKRRYAPIACGRISKLSPIKIRTTQNSSKGGHP